MKRISLTDGGGWFDADAAAEFDEATRWNGNNHISRATGSQWNHERLYYTRSGRWVLHHWSQYQGSLPSYAEVEGAEAVTWLIRNEHTDPAELDILPPEVRAEVVAGFEAAEV